MKSVRIINTIKFVTLATHCSFVSYLIKVLWTETEPLFAFLLTRKLRTCRTEVYSFLPYRNLALYFFDWAGESIKDNDTDNKYVQSWRFDNSNTSLADTKDSWTDPVTLENIRMRPLFDRNIQWKKNSCWSYGFTWQSKLMGMTLELKIAEPTKKWLQSGCRWYCIACHVILVLWYKTVCPHPGHILCNKLFLWPHSIYIFTFSSNMCILSLQLFVCFFLYFNMTRQTLLIQ